MGVIRPFQPDWSKHLWSRAGSGRGVHRAYWKGAMLYPWAIGTGMQGPYWKGAFCTPGHEQDSGAGSGPSQGSVGPGQPVGVKVGGGNGGRGIGCSGRSCRRWRLRQDRDGGGENGGELRWMALPNRMARWPAPQDAARLLRTVLTGPWPWRGSTRALQNHRKSAATLLVGRAGRSRPLPVPALFLQVIWAGQPRNPCAGIGRGRILDALSGFSSVSPA